MTNVVDCRRARLMAFKRLLDLPEWPLRWSSSRAAFSDARDWSRASVLSRLFLAHAAARIPGDLVSSSTPLSRPRHVFGLVLSVYRTGSIAVGANRERLARNIPSAARWSLLCGTSLLGIGVAEAGAAAWLGWIHRLPVMFVEIRRTC